MRNNMKLRLFTMMLTVLAFLGMSSLAFAQKVAVCHVTGNGTYHLILINTNALPAHLAHGDGQPGGAVPNMSGYIFGDNCGPTLAPPPEPAVGCYALPNDFDIYYVGPIDMLQNYTIYSSNDGSCTSPLGTVAGTAIIASDSSTDAQTKCNALTAETPTYVTDLTGASPSLPGFWYCTASAPF
jgi:hypothetical protein